MNKRQANMIYRKVIYAYNQLEEDSPSKEKLETELYYLDLMREGKIVCEYHPSEPCEKCRFFKECDLYE